jgi:hypothetical protein
VHSSIQLGLGWVWVILEWAPTHPLASIGVGMLKDPYPINQRMLMPLNRHDDGLRQASAGVGWRFSKPGICPPQRRGKHVVP